MTHLYVGAIFFAAALLAGIGIWVLLRFLGVETVLVITLGALAFGAGAALVDYLTERR